LLSKVMLEVPVNRVEGDLEIRVEMEDNVVTDAWSSGIMFRGIENMLLGRGAYDSLVITPRICGICTTAHLSAAVQALEAVAGVQIPADAARVRNLAQATEHIQSDLRQCVLMFMVDFAQPAYQGHPLHEEAMRRYEPLKGETVIETVRETRKVLEIVAIVAGQWPHSSFMVPGGVTSAPTQEDLLQSRYLLRRFRKWYEERILGCPLERWTAISNGDDLEAWLEESQAHEQSDLGFFIRMARAAGLEGFGRGHDNFISFGQLVIPSGSEVHPVSGRGNCFMPAGFAQHMEVAPFDQTRIAEHVACSWYESYEGGRHPFEGVTRPYAAGEESNKYSWAKAPRYEGLPAETGPLAERIVAKDPLFIDLISRGGSNAFLRQLARWIRPVLLIPAMEKWIDEIRPDSQCYESVREISSGEGFGITEAARGALGHWVKIDEGKIRHYQVITPTAWNGSPRDERGARGPWEEALIGTTIKDPENPVELGHVIRSFDPCLVCTVHAVAGDRRLVRCLG
jgi:hydrogenase large subunit